ncbi:MAG: DNA topoisomerase, partial [Candidatus Korarchaeota archaeon]|nr:DNA topoisomerase [Candidatus Korarchaeota archaeon]
VSRITGLTPKLIADRSTGIAQQLYEAGLISYIGTESQKYPKNWTKEDFVRMVELIGSYSPLEEDASFVLRNMRDRPVEGKKNDPAHPTIHVVGSPEEEFQSRNHRRVYEIIARRNLATLAPDALIKRVNVEIPVEEYRFKASGAALLEEGWLRVYPYAKKDYLMPPVDNGEEVKCIDVKIEEKETQPPKRYTPVSIIKEMEKLGLGTKNTRVQILDILRERGYIEGKSFKPTPLGEAVAEVLEEYVPELTSPELTAKLEEAMTKIERGELDHSSFLSDALLKLERIMRDFKSKEGLISEKLAKAVQAYRLSQNIVGKCPKCGRDLLLKKSKYGYFVICSGYPDECDVKFNLLPRERILREECKCGLPLVEGGIKTKSKRTLKYVRCLGNCEESPVRCAKCGGVMVPKKGKFGVYLQCRECGSVNFFRVRKR